MHRPLTHEEVQSRWAERAVLDAKLAELQPMRRRLAHIIKELTLGVYLPPPGVSSAQLPLLAEDKADLEVAAEEAVAHNRREDIRSAILQALEGRTEATVPGLVKIVARQFQLTKRLPATTEEIRTRVDALVSSGLLMPGKKRGWYKRAPRGVTTPAKPASQGPVLWKQSHRPGILPGLTSAGARRALALLAAAPGRRLPKEEICAHLGVPSDVCMPSGVCYQSGDWVLKEAPREAPKATLKAARTRAAKAKPPRALGDVVDGVLRTWGTWLDERHLEARVREAMPLNAVPSTRDWTAVTKDMLAQRRIERREEEGQVQYRIRPLQEVKLRPTVTVGEAVGKMLAAHPPQRWAKARALVARRLAGNEGRPMPIAGLYLSSDGQGAEIDAVLSLLVEAGAAQHSQSGTQRLIEAGAAVREGDIPGEILRLTQEYLLGLVTDRPEPPTTDELAVALELPRNLVLSVLDELRDAGRLHRGTAGRWITSAQDRTAPLFPEVPPAPAREEAAE